MPPLRFGYDGTDDMMKLNRIALFSGVSWLLLIALLAGCGTVATPVYEAPTATPETRQDPAEQPPTETATPMPTATSIPPTLTPTPEPTATDEPSPTPEPTAAPALSPIDRMVAARDAENGALLFQTFQEAALTGYSCANCHSPDSDEQLVGPGLVNIAQTAATRVESQSAAEYLYNSIVNPNDYLVEGFEADLMPLNWAEIYTNLEIFDLVAYLLTL